MIPHGSSVYAYHLQYAFPNCPVAEFINLSRPVWKSNFTARSCSTAWRCRLIITTRHTGLFPHRSPRGDAIVPYFGGLFLDEPLPANGRIDLPDRPGFGVTLDRTGLTRPYQRTPADVAANYRANQNAGAAAAAVHMPF